MNRPAGSRQKSGNRQASTIREMWFVGITLGVSQFCAAIVNLKQAGNAGFMKISGNMVVNQIKNPSLSARRVNQNQT
ncbi:hypothetical protein MNBD_ALPHA12-2144 [hydrothermal vent metagenome]|uniref:Uncharacterized protein n=1 Tax=hydrothermal vent metagenome TaxID=652676 RepID=A0A3B0TQ28_9ZZZZ